MLGPDLAMAVGYTSLFSRQDLLRIPWALFYIIPSPGCMPKSLNHMALSHMIGSFSQAASEDHHIRDATAHVFIKFLGAF